MAKEAKDLHVDVKTGAAAAEAVKAHEAPKEKVHKAGVGDIVLFYKNEQLNSGGSKLTPFAGLVLSTVGAEGNMQPQDHGVNLLIWSKLGYPEVKSSIRFSEVPAHGLWSKKP